MAGLNRITLGCLFGVLLLFLFLGVPPPARGGPVEGTLVGGGMLWEAGSGMAPWSARGLPDERRTSSSAGPAVPVPGCQAQWLRHRRSACGILRTRRRTSCLECWVASSLPILPPCGVSFFCRPAIIELIPRPAGQHNDVRPFVRRPVVVDRRGATKAPVNQSLRIGHWCQEDHGYRRRSVSRTFFGLRPERVLGSYTSGS